MIQKTDKEKERGRKGKRRKERIEEERASHEGSSKKEGGSAHGAYILESSDSTCKKSVT